MLGKKAIYYPRQDSDKIGFYDNVVNRLDERVAAKYGITPETMEVLRQYRDAIPEKIGEAYHFAQIAKSKTQEKKDVLRDSEIAIKRVLKKIQSSENFEESDAELLGFRVLRQKPDLREVKPVIRGTIVLPDKILVKWTKGRMDGVVVYGRYNDTEFEEIGRAFFSPFVDLRKNRAKHAESRYYYLVYLKNDEVVGQESNTTKVAAEVY